MKMKGSKDMMEGGVEVKRLILARLLILVSLMLMLMLMMNMLMLIKEMLMLMIEMMEMMMLMMEMMILMMLPGGSMRYQKLGLGRQNRPKTQNVRWQKPPKHKKASKIYCHIQEDPRRFWKVTRL